MGDPKIAERGFATRWTSGNAPRGGRQKGARDKLSAAFMAAVQADFEKHGDDVVKAVRTDDPAKYLQIVAMLQPKQTEEKAPDPFDGMSVEDLEAHRDQVEKILAEERLKDDQPRPQEPEQWALEQLKATRDKVN